MSNTWIARDAQYQLVFMCIPIIAETIHATADDEWNTTLWEGLPVLSSSSSCFATGKANSLSHPTSVVCVCFRLWISLFQMPNRRGKKLLRSDGIIVSVVGSCAHTPEGTTFP